MKIQYPLSGKSPECTCLHDIDFKGETYTVNASFDKVLRIFDLLGDNSVSGTVRLDAALDILLLQKNLLQREEREHLLKAVMEHFSPSDNSPETANVDVKGNPLPIKKMVESYRINYDGDFIYSAFMQAYGIDLIDEQGKLDWNKFCALLKGLPKDTKFVEVCGYRTYEKPSKKDTYEKQMMKLKEFYALPELGGEDDG